MVVLITLYLLEADHGPRTPRSPAHLMLSSPCSVALPFLTGSFHSSPCSSPLHNPFLRMDPKWVYTFSELLPVAGVSKLQTLRTGQCCFREGECAFFMPLTSCRVGGCLIRHTFGRKICDRITDSSAVVMKWWHRKSRWRQEPGRSEILTETQLRAKWARRTISIIRSWACSTLLDGLERSSSFL